MSSSGRIASNLLGLVGAVLGAILGYYTFRWIYHHGFYGMMIPGALLGLGCGSLARHPSAIRGAACAAAALALGLFAEWSVSYGGRLGLGEFFSEIAEPDLIAILMMAAGAYFAYLFGKDCATGYVGSIGARRRRESNMNASHFD
jgi:hypothetical protein